MLLYFMNFPKDFSQLVPGQLRFPSHVDGDLSNIITQMVALEPSSRPSAATALTHPYFRATFVDRLMEEGEIVEQDRKLDAVRNLLSRTRYSYRNIFEKVTVRRSHVLDDVIQYFKTVPIEKLKHHLRVTFANEPGVDEGGLLTEMFSIFFDVIFHPGSGLFEDCFGSISHNESSEDGNATMDGNVVLPSTTASSSSHIESFRAVGKAMVKAFYEGRRIGNRLSPSAFKFFTGAQPNTRDLQLFDPQTAKSLQWMLATVGVEDLGFHFETVGKPELGEVDDNNKGTFVRMKTESVLIQSRIKQLTALKEGFLEALQGISTEAAPFLNLLSHTDWRIMLCGDTVINPQQIVAALRFSGFPTRSKIPQWLTELICSASEDHLRKFLIFVTGSPSITNSFSSSSSSSSTIRINVRHQTRSAALPTAHTCFFHLDIPDYAEKETFQNKLLYAIQNSNTFEIV
jgi:serine/threonine protein kinase